MRLLWLCLLLQSVYTQAGFGRSYMGNSRLCHEWNCINVKLGLSNVLPPRDHYTTVLKSLLPEGPWQDVVDNVLKVCYEDRPRRYTNTCPGQALLHCVVDNLVNNCPESSWRQDDSCTPVSSIAGLKYMFSQSKYENLERNLPSEVRPVWFLKNYFSTKCCDLPQLFNTTVLNECGFNTIIHYYNNKPRPTGPMSVKPIQPHSTTTPKYERETLKIVQFNTMEPITQSTNNGYTLKIVDLDKVEESIVPQDPLDCCDIEDFIRPSWRSECQFQLSWEGQNRLTIKPDPVTPAPPTTTTAKPLQSNNVKVVPHSCEKESCVFRKLNIISEAGQVDMDAFSKLLDNVTNNHPEWRRAKARVVTKCLTKPIRDYEADCDINKVLACTFDVLSENCPYAKKNDPCKHTNTIKNDTLCQISSSKFRPKNRRQYCGLPSLVNHEVLAECELNLISHIEYVPEPPASNKFKHRWAKDTCTDSTESTRCLMIKLDVLNKYDFMDYFKMKDRIRSFTGSHEEWSSLTRIYLSVYANLPMYSEHCSSGQRLLNIIDSMLMTCPISKRRNNAQCNKLFEELNTTVPNHKKQNITKEKLAQALGHFHHIFIPDQQMAHAIVPDPRPRIRIVKEPIFSFGLLGSASAPKVRIINVKPKDIPERPLVLLPVYQRFSTNLNGRLNLYMRPYDGIMRSSPFQLNHTMKFTRIPKVTTEPGINKAPGVTSSAPSVKPTPPVFKWPRI